MLKRNTEGLYEMLVGRNQTRPEGSYTTYLFEKGIDHKVKQEKMTK